MAYEKAVGMKYRWAEGDAADLLGQIFLVSGDKAKGRQWLKKAVVCRKEILQWLKKAVVCRKEILDPKVKETEGKLKGKSDKG
jgi:hypothetical protein